MAKITKVHAREILDSRGNPTIECEVTLEDGSMGWAAVPSGASTGDFEAIELRDNDPRFYNGHSVQNAVNNVNKKIAALLVGKDASNQYELDKLLIDLDGTPNKAALGANAILSVSMSIAVAESVSQKLELFEYLSKFSPKKDEPFVLPYPMMNLMNGGRHALRSTDFQEYMIIPKQTSTFRDRLRCGAEVFQGLQKVLLGHEFQTLVGDEGGFAPSLKSNETPLEFIIQAIEKAGYRPGEDVMLAMDIAASEFYANGKYILKSENKTLDKEELFAYYQTLLSKYPIESIEDPLDQNDFEGWAEFTKRFGKDLQIVGDDLYVTNVDRLNKGIELGSSNSILIKLNQIGTLTETIEAINFAHSNGMTAIVSHRSGETEDTFIADLVVAMRTGQIKTGSLSRSERTAKYNRLLRIEEYLEGVV